MSCLYIQSCQVHFSFHHKNEIPFKTETTGVSLFTTVSQVLACFSTGNATILSETLNNS